MFFASVLGVLTAGIMLGCISLFVLFGLVATISVGSSQDLPIDDNAILKIDVGSLSEVVVSSNLLSYASQKDDDVSLTDAVAAIKKAKDNDKIKGIYLNMPGISAGLASIGVLRKAIEDFKASGKFVLAYADTYTQKGYYLASVADKVYLHPQGAVELNGIASQTMFYKDALQKLGVEMMIFKVGTYKGAVEPFMLDKLSEPNRKQIEEYANGLWDHIKTTVASSRKINSEQVQLFADSGYSFGQADLAVRAHLVDSLSHRFDVEDVLRSLTDKEPEEDLSFVSLARMSKEKGEKGKQSDDAIRVIYAEGEINDGGSSNPFNRSDNSINQSLATELRRAAKDDDIKAVVMRVNSPGGSAFVSDVIWKQVVELKKKKPIVVSMGDMAASGGYYISCASDYIFAEPMTLTGSIGIFGMFPNLKGVAQKIGITTDVVKTAKYADMGMMFEPITDEEKALIQSRLEQGYDTFISRVAEGRKMTKATVDSVGQGRVWLGEKALKLGLVDQLGGLEDAIAKAAELAKIDTYKVDYSKTHFDFLEMLFKDAGSLIRQQLAGYLMTEEEIALLRQLRTSSSQTGYRAALPIGFRPY